ncbi:MAG: hypothetical protein A3H97_11235 [Acidobacteria bacterium RIFCSPLOWO2_02_FULL_65_29]|nr:MAG: hypothetical protein A3H97_11235 [Acidobacteria bacterium RIFCSPLOWO2_02_FULL_65_29]
MLHVDRLVPEIEARLIAEVVEDRWDVDPREYLPPARPRETCPALSRGASDSPAPTAPARLVSQLAWRLPPW